MRTALLALLLLALPGLAWAQSPDGCTAVHVGGGVYSIYCPPQAPPQHPGHRPPPDSCSGTRLGPAGPCMPDNRRGPLSPGYDRDPWLELWLDSLRDDTP